MPNIIKSSLKTAKYKFCDEISKNARYARVFPRGEATEQAPGAGDGTLSPQPGLRSDVGPHFRLSWAPSLGQDTFRALSLLKKWASKVELVNVPDIFGKRKGLVCVALKTYDVKHQRVRAAMECQEAGQR